MHRRLAFTLAASMAFTACGGSTVAERTAIGDGGTTPEAEGSAMPNGDATVRPEVGLGADASSGDSSPPFDPGCPESVPTAGGACNVPGSACSYSASQCRCVQLGRGADASAWSCTACPATRPGAGAACTPSPPSGYDCAYGADQCACLGGGWKCGVCPHIQPPSGGACDVPFGVCNYVDSGATCTCGSFPMWSCVGPCPATQPTSGDACNTFPFQACSYGGVTCECMNNVFFCS